MKSGWILFMILLLPVCVFADSPEGDIELTIYSGLSFLTAEKEEELCIVCIPGVTNRSTIDTGVTFGARGGYYLSRSIELEGAFHFASDRNVRTENIDGCEENCPLILMAPVREQKIVSYQYEGNLVYHLSSGDLRPFFSLGALGMTSDLQSGLHHDFGVSFGTGAKFYFKNIGLRVELRDTIIPNYFLTEKTEHDIQVQYGFLIRLP